MTRSHRRLIWTPLFVFACLVALAVVREPSLTLDAPWLLAGLNLVFLTAVPLAAAALAVVAYRATGVVAVLALGMGMLITGLGCGILPALLLLPAGATPNDGVTVHNVSALTAGGLQFLAVLGAIHGYAFGAGRRWHVVVGYGVACLVVAGVLLLTLVDGLPPFWTSGRPEAVRQEVVGAAAMLFSLAAFGWYQMSVRDREIRFLDWYVPGLALSALALVSILAAGVFGGPLIWLGRLAQYASAVYLLVAVAVGIRAGQGVPADAALGASLLQAALPFRPLVDSSSDAVVGIGASGRVIYCNEAARRLLGGEPSQAFDSDPALLLRARGETTDSRIRTLMGPPALTRAGRQQVELHDADGRVFPAEILLFANPDDPRLMLCVIDDVSERVEARAELERRVSERTAELEASNAELARANHAKDEFLGLVSHELKTPITTILAAATIAEKAAIRKGHDGDLLHDIVLETNRLASIVDNLLALARLGAHQTLEAEPVALAHLLRSVAAEVARQHGCTIEVRAGPGITVEGNEGQLAMVVRNYLVNAAKYGNTPAGIEVLACERDGYVEVEVLDRGPGIDESDADSLFDPFQRGSAGATVGGIGIGLTVCRRIVVAHGGTAGVRDREEGGAAFWFRLPAAHNDPADEDPWLTPAADSRQRLGAVAQDA